MTYDVFMFHGELDILELRLNILNNVVDRFVICEADKSLNGEKYESAYLANLERFKPWQDKIIHYQFEMMKEPKLIEMAKKSPNTNGDSYWMQVFYMFESLKNPLKDCKDNDIVFISDCDEIWNPEAEINLIDLLEHKKVIGLNQFVYYYQLNNRCSEPWTGTICVSYGRLKNEILNNIKQKGEIKLSNGGWHFTYQGGEEKAREKIITTGSGTYYNIPVEILMNEIKQGKDFFGRGYGFWVDESEWPQFLKENRQKYLKMLK